MKLRFEAMLLALFLLAIVLSLSGCAGLQVEWVASASYRSADAPRAPMLVAPTLDAQAMAVPDYRIGKR